MDSQLPGWFTEMSPFHNGQTFSLEVEKVLYHQRSKFQDILLFKSKTYGNVLVLDGMIQYTERDEFSYQEMLTHIALNSHPSPKHVLVVGGGDGGVIREVLKHPLLETVTQCEIDEKVIEVSKKYLKKNIRAFEDPKLDIFIADGVDFLKNHENSFDVIINDCSDTGPALPLFQLPFYQSLKQALKPGGVTCAQEEGMWNNLDDIKAAMQRSRTLFPTVDYAWSSIPTLPGGHIGFLCCGACSKKENTTSNHSLEYLYQKPKKQDVSVIRPSSVEQMQKTNFREPVRIWGPTETKKYNLSYYSADVHRAAFTIPEFARRVLYEELSPTINGIKDETHSD